MRQSEGGLMVFENNFTVLNDRMLVDPVLKIFVSMGRMHEEGEGLQVLHISHDPDMRPSVLTLVEEWREVNENAVDEKKIELSAPEFSERSFRFFEFTVRKITEGKTLVWELAGPDEIYQQANLGSVQRGNLYDCPDQKAFLLYMFGNLLPLPELKNWGYWGYTEAQLKIPATKYAYLTGRGVDDVQSDVVLDERKVEVGQCKKRKVA